MRDLEPAQWHQHTAYWGHVGIYGYRADVLLRWNTLPHSPLERNEKLEQLRLIKAALSVDTAEQLEQARAIAVGQVD